MEVLTEVEEFDFFVSDGGDILEGGLVIFGKFGLYADESEARVVGGGFEFRVGVEEV